jgi:hypothetical protein
MGACPPSFAGFAGAGPLDVLGACTPDPIEIFHQSLKEGCPVATARLRELEAGERAGTASSSELAVLWSIRALWESENDDRSRPEREPVDPSKIAPTYEQNAQPSSSYAPPMTSGYSQFGQSFVGQRGRGGGGGGGGHGGGGGGGRGDGRGFTTTTISLRPFGLGTLPFGYNPYGYNPYAQNPYAYGGYGYGCRVVCPPPFVRPYNPYAVPYGYNPYAQRYW